MAILIPQNADPSYGTGFALPGNEPPLHPELWKGCVAAWTPSLGRTGQRLVDHGPSKSHGAFVSVTAAAGWVNNNGWALNLAEGNHFVDLGSKSFLTDGEPYSVAWWEYVVEAPFGFPSRISLSVNEETDHFVIVRVKSTAAYDHLFWGRSPSTNATIRSNTITSPADVIGQWIHFAITGSDPLDSTVSSHKLYENGVSHVVSQGGTTSSVPNNRIGYNAVNGTANCLFDDVRIYDRRLSAQEVRLLASSRTIAYRLAPLIVSGLAVSGAVKPLDAAVTGTGVMTANLSITRGLTASVTGTANLTTALGRKRIFVAPITGSALVAANLNRTVGLSAPITGSALVAANLNRTVGLSASVTGTGLATAALDTSGSVSLVAIVSASATVAADLDRTIGLKGDVVGSCVATAALGRTRTFAASISGSVLVSADLGRTIGLTAPVTASSLATANVAIDVALSASVDGSSLVTAAMDIGGDISLAAALTSTATVTAGLVRRIGLTADIAGSASVTAAISSGATIAFTSPVAASGVVTADLDRTVGLISAVSTSALVTADLTVIAGTIDFAAAISGSVTVGATLSATRPLSADVSGSSTVTATLDATGDISLAAVVSNDATVTANLSNTVSFTAAVNASATATANANLSVGFAAAIELATVVTGRLGGTVSLSAGLSGTATGSAALDTGLIPLSAGVDASAVLTANLIVMPKHANIGIMGGSLQGTIKSRTYKGTLGRSFTGTFHDNG